MSLARTPILLASETNYPQSRKSTNYFDYFQLHEKRKPVRICFSPFPFYLSLSPISEFDSNESEPVRIMNKYIEIQKKGCIKRRRQKEKKTSKYLGDSVIIKNHCAVFCTLDSVSLLPRSSRYERSFAMSTTSGVHQKRKISDTGTVWQTETRCDRQYIFTIPNKTKRNLLPTMFP